ncbi:hypothetical protein J2X46_003991 [Nocardioides sp. BE266]|uniref:hypothetical protein n=1 Tax=Nocardioides sp. BE266 TaxID=2817725 RepID=UPI002864FA5C|nr:hypothetical protein [Nocardioides sp. BE266]MDR7254989.1 hypothetical protein [Nocardioides sp. BE266]
MSTRTYADGYQAALDDLALALDRDGSDGVWTWIYYNAEAMSTRNAVRHLARPETAR